MVQRIWRVAVGDSGFQDLPAPGEDLGPSGEQARKAVEAHAARWSNQRTPTFLLVRKGKIYASVIDCLATDSVDHAGRPPSARLISVFQHDDLGEMEYLLGLMLRPTVSGLFIRDAAGRVAFTSKEVVPEGIGRRPTLVLRDDERWLTGDRRELAEVMMTAAASGPLPSDGDGAVAIASDWLDPATAEGLREFRFLCGDGLPVPGEVGKIPKVGPNPIPAILLGLVIVALVLAAFLLA